VLYRSICNEKQKVKNLSFPISFTRKLPPFSHEIHCQYLVLRVKTCLLIFIRFIATATLFLKNLDLNMFSKYKLNAARKLKRLLRLWSSKYISFSFPMGNQGKEIDCVEYVRSLYKVLQTCCRPARAGKA